MRGQGDKVPGDEVGDSAAAYRSALDDFAADLRRLRIAQGSPTYKELLSRAARLQGKLSQTTVCEAFTGKRLPALKHIRLLIRALTKDPQAEQEWQLRWERLEELHQASVSRSNGSTVKTSAVELSRLREENRQLSDSVKILTKQVEEAKQQAEGADKRAADAEARAKDAGNRAVDAEERAKDAEHRAAAAVNRAKRVRKAYYRHYPAGGVALTQAAGPVLSIAFHPEDHLLAAGYADGRLMVWDVDGERVHGGWSSVNGGCGPVYSVAFSRDGGILAAGSADGKVRFVLSGTSQFSGDPLTFIGDSPVANGPEIRSVAFGPGNLLAVGDARGMVRVWRCHSDGESRVHSQLFRTHQFDGAVRSLAFMPDRLLLAAGTDQGPNSASVADVLDLAAPEGELLYMKFSGSPVHSVAFSGDGALLAIAEDNEVHMKGLDDCGLPNAEGSYSIRCRGVRSLAFNPASGHLAIGAGRTCTLYTLRAGLWLPEPPIKENAAVRSLAFRRDGDLLAIGREDGVVQLYGPGAGQT